MKAYTDGLSAGGRLVPVRAVKVRPRDAVVGLYIAPQCRVVRARAVYHNTDGLDGLAKFVAVVFGEILLM